LPEGIDKDLLTFDKICYDDEEYRIEWCFGPSAFKGTVLIRIQVPDNYKIPLHRDKINKEWR
jgi:hypothetical protein